MMRSDLPRAGDTTRSLAAHAELAGIRATSQPLLATSIDYASPGASTVCREIQEVGGNTVTCQGYNEFGLVGNGMPTYMVGASPVVNSSGFVQVRGSSYAPVCAVDTAGRVYCWGWTGDDNLIAAGVTGITAAPAEITIP